MSDQNVPQRYVFTLVQGTRVLPDMRWLRRREPEPPWTNSNSKFCQGLREAFAGHDVIIEELPWSRRNRALDRGAAASDLARRVTINAKADPDARQIVIGHSHGGTIGCLALNEPGYERSVAGIVCLSTPFIHARPRTSGATFEITLALPALLLTVVTWIGLGTLQQDYWVYLLLGGLGAAFLLWVAICLFWRFGPEDEVLYRQAENEGGATKGLDWRSYRLHTDPELRAVADTATRMLGSVRLPQSKRLQPLIVRVAGDEASGALAVARFGAWLGSLALPAVRGGSKVAAGLAGLVLIVVASLSFESAWSRYPSESRVPFPISASLFALLVTPIAVAVYSVAFLVATGLLALPTFTSALPMLAYGIDLGPLLTRFEFSVEETPKGRHIVEQLSFVDARLSHCGAYDHDALPETIREWLQRRPRSEEDSDSETTGNSARPANDQRLRV